jgi:hypothetical protein
VIVFVLKLSEHDSQPLSGSAVCNFSGTATASGDKLRLALPSLPCGYSLSGVGQEVLLWAVTSKTRRCLILLWTRDNIH